MIAQSRVSAAAHCCTIRTNATSANSQTTAVWVGRCV